MNVFLPHSLRNDVEERITYAQKLYDQEVVPRVHNIINPSEKMLEFIRCIDFEYQLEIIYLLLGEQRNDNVLVTGAKFLGYKFNADTRAVRIELEPIQEGAKPIGILHSHPFKSGFSEGDLTNLPLLKNALGGWGCVLMLYNEKTREYVAIDTSSREADVVWYDEAS